MKKVLSIMLAIVVLLSCMTITAFAKEQNSKITSALAEKIEKLPEGEKIETCIWLFYQHDADLIERKTYEECGLTAGTCMTLEEVDIYSKTYNRIAGKLEAAGNKALIEKAGISDEDIVFCGTMSPMVILNLTKEQIYTIAEFKEVQTLDYDNTVLMDDPSDPDLPYEPLDPVEPTYPKEQNSKITSALAEKIEKLPEGEKVETCIWLFYQHDADLIERKTYEECGLTAGTCMTLEEVDIYSKTYNRIAGELEAADNKALIEKAGVADENIVFCGTMSPLVILNLTKEQIYTISTFTEVQTLDYDNTVLVDDPSDPDLPYEPLSFLKGDADIDGEVTVIDATFIQRSEVGIKCPTIIIVDTADVDGDGYVSIIDATLIQRHLVGIPTRFKIGEYI